MCKANLVCKIMISTMFCGMMMFAGCGGGSGSSGGSGAKKSGLPGNELLGNSPALYADNDLAQEADRAKLKDAQEKITNESSAQKFMELKQKTEKAAEEREAKFRENVDAEWKKINGKAVPFTASAKFNQTNIQVKSVKLDADRNCMKATIVAKDDFVKNANNMRDYGYAWYKLLAKDGSVIATDGFFLATGGAEIVLRPKSYAAGQSLHYEGGDADGNLKLDTHPVEMANFASIEFIIDDERE